MKEEPKVTPNFDTDIKDDSLVLITLWAELGSKVGITLSLGGVIVSGKTFSGREFAAKHKERMRNDEHNGDKKAVEEFVRTVTEAMELDTGMIMSALKGGTTEESFGRVFNLMKYIHLQDARVFTGSGFGEKTGVPVGDWRCRLSAVDAYTVGEMVRG